MTALPSDLRKRLEKIMIEARIAAEQGARKALDALAVGRHEPHGTMSAELRILRNRLRAHARQLGDILDKQKGSQSTRRLEREVAYEHWHRMLFARFLAENGLLIEPESSVAVTLEECEDLAREQGVDAWVLAASYAQGMLPQIFRPDDPALAVTLPPETRQSLQRLLADLPAEVFTADDSLGWTYQFWQSAEKDAVNARVKSGEKITGETLPAVTQLFTEHYMVQFLLHNTIGAWHAGKILAADPELAKSATCEQVLRDAVALDGYAFDYLRFVREPLEGEDPNEGTGPWRPAAGTYSGWPKRASELTVLDPCCGSGHFLVAAFDLLVRLRLSEDGLDLENAIRRVLSENLFGLELDARCTQLAAFQLALAAWRLVGSPLDLPTLQIACCGIGPNATKEEWVELAEQAAAQGGMPAKRDLFGKEDSLLSDALRTGLEQLHDAFGLAPELGSLIDPSTLVSDLFRANFEQLQPMLSAVLDAETVGDELHERAVAAQGMAHAARILVGPRCGYTLVITNVPYLGRGSQSDTLRDFASKHYGDAKADLATVFVSRMLRWAKRDKDGAVCGTVAAVTPQNWLFLSSYRKLRERLLEEQTWEVVARLGHGAFETIGGQVVNVALIAISRSKPAETHLMAGLDVSAHRGQPPILAAAKATLLRGEGEAEPHPQSASAPIPAASTPSVNPPHKYSVCLATQGSQLRNPGRAIALVPIQSGTSIASIAYVGYGSKPGQTARVTRLYWEIESPPSATWILMVSTPNGMNPFSGRSLVCLSQSAIASQGIDEFGIRGSKAWGKDGVIYSKMSHLPAAIYCGEFYDDNTNVIVPTNPEHVAALWSYISSPAFNSDIRRINSKLNVTRELVMALPFDLTHWMNISSEHHPDGVPEPQSNDPSQWLFHGYPTHAEPSAVLQVAVARLVGYRWPAELDEDMRLADVARKYVRRCADLAEHTDKDGIVCLSSIQGEGSAADRLRSLLAKAFGPEWSAAKEQDLLRAAGEKFDKGRSPRSIEDWLRDRFFEEHCALFHHRPFVWHVWDGLPGGFHALVNYHKLAGPAGQGRRTLEKLTSTYLGEWIDRQRQLATAGEEGADGRLSAALSLQAELRKILEGEPPYDIFVRWKPLHEQPLGWDPDINDGVRLNIRPFLLAKDMGKKNAGILRAKPDNTWCNGKKPGVVDRGKEPESLRPREHFPWFWSCDPEQHPEHRKDFGASTPGATAAGKAFTGVRWNGLHYTRAAKEAARRAAASRGAVEEAGS